MADPNPSYSWNGQKKLEHINAGPNPSYSWNGQKKLEHINAGPNPNYSWNGQKKLEHINAGPNPGYSWNGQKKLERINDRFRNNEGTPSESTARAQGVLGRAIQSSQRFAGSVLTWSLDWLDQLLPPERRYELVNNTRTFVNVNPKLSAFIGLNLVLAGVPVIIFITLSLGLLAFTSVAGVLLGLLAAVCFTFFCIGLALIIFLPTVTFAITAACSLFIWGLAGYYVIRWVSNVRNGRSSRGQVASSQTEITTARTRTDALDIQKPYHQPDGNNSSPAQESVATAGAKGRSSPF